VVQIGEGLDSYKFKIMKQKSEKFINNLIEEGIEIIGCDTARIIQPLDKMFFIIGYYRNTKDNEETHWINGKNERIDFDYTQESVIASGKTKKELLDSIKEYKRLCNITWEEYFEELKNK